MLPGTWLSSSKREGSKAWASVHRRKLRRHSASALLAFLALLGSAFNCAADAQSESQSQSQSESDVAEHSDGDGVQQWTPPSV